MVKKLGYFWISDDQKYGDEIASSVRVIDIP